MRKENNLQDKTPLVIEQIVPDSYIGTVSFNWGNQNYKKIMNFLDFQCASKRGQELYTKKIKLSYICSITSYPNGTMMLNGCHSFQEMEDIVLQLLQKMSYLEGMNIKIVKNLKTLSFRARIQYKNVFFDIKNLSKYVYQRQNQYYKNQSRTVLPFVPQISKLLIPQFIHNIRGMKVFVYRIGYLQIYKANLVQDLQQFGTEIYESLIKTFSIPKPNKTDMKIERKQEYLANRIQLLSGRKGMSVRESIFKKVKIIVKNKVQGDENNDKQGQPKRNKKSLTNKEQAEIQNQNTQYGNQNKKKRKIQQNQNKLNNYEQFVRYQFSDEHNNKNEDFDAQFYQQY